MLNVRITFKTMYLLLMIIINSNGTSDNNSDEINTDTAASLCRTTVIVDGQLNGQHIALAG